MEVSSTLLGARRLPILTSDLSSIPSPLPLELRTQQIFDFDTDQYPFREAVAEQLEVRVEDLPRLHTLHDLRKVLCQNRPKKKAYESPFIRHWHRQRSSAARGRFNILLDKFVREFVEPRMGVGEKQEPPSADCSGSSRTRIVAYQREPTFRVQEPSDIAIGEPHVDAEYHHPPAEVNWWLPLTSTWGSNTLYIESEPGAGDHAPAQLKYGQILRFYGNLCHHYTVPNQTGFCRVSFDMRILALKYHDVNWVDRLGGQKYKTGEFYTIPGASLESRTPNADNEDVTVEDECDWEGLPDLWN